MSRFGGIRIAKMVACLLFALLQGACREKSATADPAPERPSAPSGLSLDLTPDPSAGTMRVEVRVTGDAAIRVKELLLTRRWADTNALAAISKLSVRDGRGELVVREPVENLSDRVFALDRAPSGELLVSYTVRSAEIRDSRYALRIARDRVSGVGHAFLLLPRIDSKVPVKIRWHNAALDPGSVGACSLGSGDEITATASTEDLVGAVYAAGKLDFIDNGAGEWMAIVGARPFEPSSTFLWTSKMLGLVRTTLDPTAPSEPFSFFFIAEKGMGKAHDGAAFDRSFGIWFDASRTFDERLEIAVAHELLHRVFGTALRLEEPPGHEAAWFSEGFTVHFARKLLFESRRISPEAFLEDLKQSSADASTRVDSDAWGASGGGNREAYGRGALYAAKLDAGVRKSSQGARTLTDVVRELTLRARQENKRAFPLSALREILVRELGNSAGDELDEIHAGRREPGPLPSDAFGPCFKRSEEGVKTFDLGFDPASLERLPNTIRGLVKGSAAEKAGVREGAWVLTAKVPDANAPVPAPRGKKKKQQHHPMVELILREGKGGVRGVRYKPEAKKTELHWHAVPCKR